ncbi:MAG: DUF4433 domain-containing protein [Oscillospiraceae bacterium]|nr:DUF4433 domain-containing protein [Oscillospiraceae bacterium]
MSIKDGKLLYHLTTLDALPSIAETGLLSRGELARRNIVFTDTADHEILSGRERLGLSDYIPFHFHHQTSYDSGVKYSHTNTVFIYIRITRNFAKEHNFKILPNHPNSLEHPDLYDYEEGFNLIDWDVMELTRPQALERNIKERYHKQVRMAECLSPVPVNIRDFQSIIVPDNDTKLIVSDIIGFPLPFIDVDENGIYF